MKKYLNKCVSFKLKGLKDSVEGIVLAIGKDYTLLAYNPADYQLDGYMILNHKYITGYRREEQEKFKQKIFDVKGYETVEVPLDNIDNLLLYLTYHYGVFGMNRKGRKGKFVLGRVHEINDDELVLKSLNPDGKWKGWHEFPIGNILTIFFDSDYINSLKLIAKEK
jgi:hypothetical protein